MRAKHPRKPRTIERQIAQRNGIGFVDPRKARVSWIFKGVGPITAKQLDQPVVENLRASPTTMHSGSTSIPRNPFKCSAMAQRRRRSPKGSVSPINSRSSSSDNASRTVFAHEAYGNTPKETRNPSDRSHRRNGPSRSISPLAPSTRNREPPTRMATGPPSQAK